MIPPIVPELFPVAADDTCNVCNCTLGKFVEFAAANNLKVIEVGEFDKFTIAMVAAGAIIGIIAWELFKYMYRYGKRHSIRNKDDTSKK